MIDPNLSAQGAYAAAQAGETAALQKTQAQKPPGLTDTYAGKYATKGPEGGVQRFAYRTGGSNTAFTPPQTSIFTAYDRSA